MTKTKTALRKVVKITHEVVNNLQLQLHPSKTYIGKISHGFNFLSYYMDDHKILPSKETIRRFQERGSALYEQSQNNRNISRHSSRNPHGRDISEYPANEPAPTEEEVKRILSQLLDNAMDTKTFATMRNYIRKWAAWTRLGLSTIEDFGICVQTLLPSIHSCWMPTPEVFSSGSCL
ncbi:MAG: hypothetical protein KBB83_06275 [Alphaproteobacteria bacterium]|nr:hypothetical protein [Alphaproteobacteria bacterium]